MRWSFVALVVVAAACGHEKKATRTPAAYAVERHTTTPVRSDDKTSYIVCSIERPIGTMIARRVCRDADDIERERAEIQTVLANQHHSQGAR